MKDLCQQSEQLVSWLVSSEVTAIVPVPSLIQAELVASASRKKPLSTYEMRFKGLMKQQGIVLSAKRPLNLYQTLHACPTMLKHFEINPFAAAGDQALHTDARVCKSSNVHFSPNFNTNDSSTSELQTLINMEMVSGSSDCSHHERLHALFNRWETVIGRGYETVIQQIPFCLARTCKVLYITTAFCWRS